MIFALSYYDTSLYSVVPLNKLTAKAGKFVSLCFNPLWRRSCFLYRVAASVEHYSVLRMLPPCDLIVDIGANRGQFALLARHINPEARIVSFEPQAAPAETFRRVFSTDSRTTLIEAAIGPESGQASIHLSARDDSSSLLPISDIQSQTFSGTYEVGTASIDVLTLDSVLPSLDSFCSSLLKLDVQGFEFQALQGCESLICDFSYVYCECSFVQLYSGQKLAADVIDWLSSKGWF